MGQPVAFFEVISPDVKRAQQFYADLFGWQMSAMGDYALVETGAGEGALGGGFGTASEQNPAGVRIYMRVDDIAAYLAKAEQLGGRQVLPATDLPGGYGQFAIFTDPDGNLVGLWA